MDYGRAGLTGAASITIGGLVLGSYTMVLVAVVAVAVCAAALRVGWRRGRSLDER